MHPTQPVFAGGESPLERGLSKGAIAGGFGKDVGFDASRPASDPRARL